MTSLAIRFKKTGFSPLSKRSATSNAGRQKKRPFPPRRALVGKNKKSRHKEDHATKKITP